MPLSEPTRQRVVTEWRWLLVSCVVGIFPIVSGNVYVTRIVSRTWPAMGVLIYAAVGAVRVITWAARSAFAVSHPSKRRHDDDALNDRADRDAGPQHGLLLRHQTDDDADP